ncbi:hypothetical protein ACFWAY_36030 [Rhodococcus sp. NPDC059968]|uniref:hypothetical protein n=1 Tax=Rhodococcus sp. NPDC059968 TaxID=3347017 RepID=UPI00366D182D
MRNPVVVTAIRIIAGVVRAPIPNTSAAPDTAPNARQAAPAVTVTSPATLTCPIR